MISRLSPLLSRDQVLIRLARAVNALLRTDSLATARLQALEGRVIGIRVLGLDLMLHAAVDHEGLLFAQESPRAPDVILSGRLADFAAFAQARRSAEGVPAGALQIQGDLGVAQAVQKLMDELALDWEALLATRVGEVAAARIGHGARLAFDWMEKAAGALEQDVPAWLQDELRAVPAAEEIEAFARDNMALASDLDRLAARIARLRLRGGE